MKVYSNEELHLQKLKILTKEERLTNAKIYGDIVEEEIAGLKGVWIKHSKQSMSNKYDIDIKLAIAMYQNEYFSNLTKEEANDENLWATINIEHFAEYTTDRWNINSTSPTNIEKRVFKKGKLLYNRNSLARLWWITQLTVDEILEDKFQYTKLILSRSQFEQSIMESSLAKNNKILKNLLRAIVKIEKIIDGEITSDEIIKIISSLNRIGGTYVLDIMDDKYFIDHIVDVLEIDY